MRDLAGEINKWYKAFQGSENSVANKTLAPMESLVRSSKNSIAFNRRIMKKTVDLSWVDAIEEGLVHLDTVLRNPRVTIEEQEEIVPIALSKKITVESVKHLAQHTNLIQSIDKKSGKITPSKILNIYKEESLMTYENKFLNTLVDRLYIFVTRRYEKLKEVSKNEDAFSVDYTTTSSTESGGSCKVTIQIEITDVPDDSSQGKYSTWERIEKIKLAAESYKSSKFCQKMGNAFIRPPVMRTNAIMKNVDLKACLILWQFIEGYDKVGYDIYIADSAQTPSEEFIADLGKIAAMNYMLLGYHTGMDSSEDIKGTKTRSYTPKILRRFNIEDPTEYDVKIDDKKDSAHGYRLSRKMPENSYELAVEINKIIELEKQYLVAEERQIIEEKRAAEEAERRRIEEEQRRAEEKRLEAERKREQERLAEEKRLREEEEKKLKELIEQQKREEEERKFEEQEELKRRERERAEADLRAKDEEARRAEEERMQQEAAKRAAADEAYAEERARKEAESEELRKQREEETAARLERERLHNERTQRLRKERRLMESKSFEEIYAEYARDPYHRLRRGVKLIAKLLGHQPDPEKLTEDQKEILKIEEKLAAYKLAEKQALKEKKLREKLEKRQKKNKAPAEEDETVNEEVPEVDSSDALTQNTDEPALEDANDNIDDAPKEE